VTWPATDLRAAPLLHVSGHPGQGVKIRGLKTQLAMLRTAGVANAAFHPDGSLAAVAFRDERAPSPAPDKNATAAAGKQIAQVRAAVAAELGIEEAALASVLAQVPEVGGAS